jgi:hypothetical protein
MSEFEKQKQEIIHAIGKLQEVYVGRKTRPQIYAMINHLQPPAQPKCSSCKYFGEWRKNSNINCRRLHLFVNTTFGCNRHSDYDKDGEV